MTKKEIGQKTAEYFAERAAGKASYSHADELLEEIMEEVEPGEEIKLPDGGKAVLKDQFTDKNGHAKNVVWKPAGVKRYELEMV